MSQPWIQDRHYGGIADNAFLGVPYSCAFSKKMETRKNPNTLTLAFKVENDSSTTINSLCKASVTIQSTGDFIVFGMNGKIWIKKYNTSSYVLVYTHTGGASILNAVEYNGYLYYFTAAKVNRIAVASINYTAWGASVTEGYHTFAVGNVKAPSNHPALEYNNKLYIGDGYELTEYDSVLNVWTDNKIEIFHDEEIRVITLSKAQIRLYSRRTAFIDYGACYLWDGAQKAYNQKIEWKGKIIHTAYNNGGDIDYVIAGRKPKLYTSNGYDYQRIKRLPGVYDNQNLFIGANAICVYDDLLCWGIKESYSASTNASAETGVYTWGQENNMYNDSLGFEYPTHNNDSLITAGSFVATQSYTINTLGTTNFALIGATLTTDGSFIPGVEYVINTIGTTDWTILGAVSNTVGLTFTANTSNGGGNGTAYVSQFTATGVGTGTGTAYYDNTTDIIGFVSVSNGDMYFSWGNTLTGLYGIDKVNTSKFADRGILDSLVFYADKTSSYKQITNMEASYQPILPGEQINLYYSPNFQSWTTTPELHITYPRTAGDDVVMTKMDTPTDTIGDIHTLQTRIELKAGTSNLTTPEFVQMWIEYNILEKGNVSS